MLYGTKKHSLTRREAAYDAVKISQFWKKPCYVYPDAINGGWTWSLERPEDSRVGLGIPWVQFPDGKQGPLFSDAAVEAGYV